MARSKPLSRKIRRDLNSISLNPDYNRANQVRRDKDDIKNISVGIMEHDAAIMYYFNEVIKPSVVDNKETINGSNQQISTPAKNHLKDPLYVP